MIQPIYKTAGVLSILVLVNLVLAANVQAGVYKWTDANGQVHYGDQPKSSEAEKVNIRANETTKPRKINSGEEKEAEGTDKKEQPKTAEAPPEKPEISRKEKNRLCKEATEDLAKILSRGRMRVKQKDGSYAYVSDQERQKRIKAAEKKKRENCR
jgi:hypothetical protein